jgi:very-short-patch-repair endonuclease
MVQLSCMSISRRELTRNITRRLRRESTIAERRLWSVLRSRRLQDLKVRRQHVIHGFVVDFFCSELRLVLEIDGAHHDDPDWVVYDKQRSAVIEGLGLQMIRISNERATREHVMDIISRLVSAKKSS